MIKPSLISTDSHEEQVHLALVENRVVLFSTQHVCRFIYMQADMPSPVL